MEKITEELGFDGKLEDDDENDTESGHSANDEVECIGTAEMWLIDEIVAKEKSGEEQICIFLLIVV